MNKLYLDNAATSYPKAPKVSEKMCEYINKVGSNVSRGIYSSSKNAGQVVYKTREMLCDLFNFDEPLNVVFTKNITESLNTIIKGYLKDGDHVIVSSMEHNAVMRPLMGLKGIEIDRVPCDSLGKLNPNDIEKYIKPNTKLLVMIHASNVCGTIIDAEAVGKICKKHNIKFVLDTAQTSGILPVDFKKYNLSALCFTGHKGLLGPQGVGGFLINSEFAKEIKPLIEGGTGSLSESELQPGYLPDKFEAGTLNIPGIYGLNASLKYIKDKGIENIKAIEDDLTKRFLDNINNMDDAVLYGINGTEGRTAVISLDFPKLDNSEVAFVLDRDFGIMTRVGLHCAPSAHKTLGSYPKGTVRFSPGHFLTVKDIDYACQCIYKTLKLLKSE